PVPVTSVKDTETVCVPVCPPDIPIYPCPHPRFGCQPYRLERFPICKQEVRKDNSPVRKEREFAGIILACEALSGDALLQEPVQEARRLDAGLPEKRVRSSGVHDLRRGRDVRAAL
ncbi:unnamed protein product, partial [Timema podura]|nr:unnamed protein product [Timema podura]